ncbi:hypothetical protein VTN02DRAFT_1356 [Thermoascus thermophilus]
MGSRPRNGSPPYSSTSSSTSTTSYYSQPPALVLLIYPFTLLLGSLYAAISPTARANHHRYDAAADPALAPTIASDINLHSHHSTGGSGSPINYFARKDNIFNVYFVKIGWLWTTLAFLALLLTQPAYTDAAPPRRARRTVQALLRYAVATASWILTTQWFFGPAIIDRSFVITGGRCEDVRPRIPGHPVSELGAIFTAAACKAAGGAWRGGHDVSGHVFMLVLATAFLAFETWGAVAPEMAAGGEGGKEKREDSGSDGDGDGDSTRSSGSVEVQDDDVDGGLKIWARRFVWAVTGLSGWMLFMTAIWFHTWLEKVTGLLIALGVVYIIYFLPRTLVPWRDIIGVLGV